MEIDETDRSILFLLQKENRMDTSTTDIADRVGVSSSTVSNRLARLRERGIIVDFRPEIDYEAAGLSHRVLFVCTAPIAEWDDAGERAMSIAGVVTVRELLTGTQNLFVEAVASDSTEIERVAEHLDALGIDVERSEIMRAEHGGPLDSFGTNLEGR